MLLAKQVVSWWPLCECDAIVAQIGRSASCWSRRVCNLQLLRRCADLHLGVPLQIGLVLDPIIDRHIDTTHGVGSKPARNLVRRGRRHIALVDGHSDGSLAEGCAEGEHGGSTSKRLHGEKT